MWTNQNLSYARALGDMLKLAEVMLQGGITARSRAARTTARTTPSATTSSSRPPSRSTIPTPAADIWYEDVETGLVDAAGANLRQGVTVGLDQK
jgi:hypothetical protein